MDGSDRDLDPPPADPEDWSDDQWIGWLKATDDEGRPGPRVAGAPVTAMGRLVHSPEGRVLGEAMLGLTEAMFGRRDDEIVVIVERSAGPGEDDAVTVQLDGEHPERSRAILRRLDPPDRPAVPGTEA